MRLYWSHIPHCWESHFVAHIISFVIMIINWISVAQNISTALKIFIYQRTLNMHHHNVSFFSQTVKVTLLVVFFAIILSGKLEIITVLSLSSWCLVIDVWLFRAVPWVCGSL